MKSIIAIGAVASGIAVFANIGTIYDNACKYIVTCSSHPEPLPTPQIKPVVLLICNGRATAMANGTIICEPAALGPMKKGAGKVRTSRSEPVPGTGSEPHYWTLSGCKGARTN